jgi:peptidyl-prolyl cis-trans isomerase B (cyclophilin B)
MILIYAKCVKCGYNIAGLRTINLFEELLVSQSSQSRKSGPPPRQNPLPAILSALVVVAIFVVLGFMLASNRPSDGQSAAAPTTDAFSAVPPADAAPTAASAPANAAPTAASAPAAPAGQPKTYSAAPAMSIDPAKTYRATIETAKGNIVLELYPNYAPKTVNNFVTLARDGFYDGLTFHRVIENFMIQGGDPQGTGGGGPGYQFEDEFAGNPLKHEIGVISMANSGPNTNGSQFFITRQPQPHLDGLHTVFGKVLEGQPIVEAIQQGDVMQKVTIAEQ